MNTFDQAKEIVKTGWAKGTLHATNLVGKESYCMVGAINKVHGIDELIDSDGLVVNINHSMSLFKQTGNEINVLNKIIEEQFPDRKGHNFVGQIPAFNDHDDTTLDEVVAVFEKASVMWEEQV